LLLLVAACSGAEPVAAPGEPAGGAAVGAPSPPEAAPAVESDPEAAAVLGLRVLHARSAGRLLARSCALRGPVGPVTCGATLHLALEFANPFPDEIELLQPEGGYGLEFRYTVERLFPNGGRERTTRVRVARLARPLSFAAGGRFRHEIDFELPEPDPVSAVWRIELGADLLLAGLRLGGRELPLDRFPLQPLRLRALPPGWEDVAAAPLERLLQAASLASPLADRHLLVAVELLPPEQRPEAVAALARALPEAPTPARATTIAVALEALTGAGIGAQPQRWLEWWGRRQNEGS
ncbi:MAG: hypothetical protein D6702_09385, partial [Planctomycetota bacterium]